jgi:regulator of protease activity HflC (stomatin/prohibitin superfamily)
MRAEIGRLTLDRTLAERAALNQNIVQAINAASFDWGVKCLRYEIRDIHPPAKVIEAMHSQVSAERQKRADILASEGQRQAAINVAEGQKQSAILAASGQAETILLKAQASAEGIRRIAEAIQAKSGHDAVSLSIAESYIEAFGRVAKEGTTVLLPANVGEPAQMVTQAMTIYETIKRQKGNSATGVEEGIKFPTTKI